MLVVVIDVRHDLAAVREICRMVAVATLTQAKRDTMAPPKVEDVGIDTFLAYVLVDNRKRKLEARQRILTQEIRKIPSHRIERLLETMRQSIQKHTGEKQMAIQTRAMAGRCRKRLEARAKLGDGGFLQGFLDNLPENFLMDLFMSFFSGMIGCDIPVDGRDARRTVERNHKGNGRYRRRFFARISRLARFEADAAGESLTRKQSHEITQVTLDEIREGDEHEMSLVIAERRKISR